ncbi:MAG: SCP2 sterol-binding domain-containing protein [Gammaproteobacteria bacterium]
MTAYARWLATAVETALNGALRLDPDSAPRLAQLLGRVIAIEPSGLGFTLYLCPGAGGAVRADAAETPDAIIRAAPLTLARLARGGQIAPGEVDISGDAQLAETFQALLRDLDIDWEEPLARVVGDVAAHQIGNQVRAIQSWGRGTIDTLFQNVAEYAQHERQDLPPRVTVEYFLDEVDRLRADADRLQARIRRLEQALDS